MTSLDDATSGRYFVRGAINIQDVSSAQLMNLHEATAYDLQPLEFALSLTGIPALVTGVKTNSRTVNTLAAANAITDYANSEVGIKTSVGTPITYESVTAVNIVGGGVATIIYNGTVGKKRSMMLVNIDAAQTVWLSFDNVSSPTVGIGIPLYPNGGWITLNVFDGSFSNQIIKGFPDGAGNCQVMLLQGD